MPAKASLIEINGHLYDAGTGELAVDSKTVMTDSPINHPVIDGFVRRRLPVAVSKPSPAQVPQSSSKPQNEPLPQTPTASKLHHTPSRTRRLLGFRPPKSTFSSGPVVLNKLSLNEQRQQKAKSASKSTLISRFKTFTTGSATASTPTQPESTRANDPPPNPRFWARPTDLPKRPRAPVAAVVIPVDEPPIRQSWSKRFLIPASVSLACLLTAAGLLIYHSIPSLSMRVASSRAGFSASVPAYHPSGFSFEGPIAYSPGKITIRFAANTDDRHYLITQKESSWDSQSLLENIVAKESVQHLTFQEHGKTIYLYDEHLATWVDGGIWYTIDNAASLSSEQLLKIAASL